MEATDGLVYLACPYSHPDPAVRFMRAQQASRAAAELMKAGLAIFSPLSHSHSIAECGLQGDWEFWEPVDRPILTQCERMIVLKLDGWEQSVGVAAEIKIADELDIPIEYIETTAVSPLVNTLFRCDWLLKWFRRLPDSQRRRPACKRLESAVREIAESSIRDQLAEPLDVLTLDHIQHTLESWDEWELTKGESLIPNP